jgi:hypothetical protein
MSDYKVCQNVKVIQCIQILLAFFSPFNAFSNQKDGVTWTQFIKINRFSTRFDKKFTSVLSIYIVICPSEIDLKRSAKGSSIWQQNKARPAWTLGPCRFHRFFENP